MNQKSLIFILIFLQQFDVSAQLKKLNVLGHWKDSTIVGSSAYDNAYNEAWGFWVNNREYGVIGSTAGTHIIDVTDPKNPVERFRIPGAANGRSIIHRDYDDFQCYLYAVCDEGPSTLQIIDISQLPDTVMVVYNSNEFMSRVHNIFIDIPRARLYTCAESGPSGFYALGLYDISNPVKPKFIGHYNRFGDINASHVHDAYVKNDTAYLNCGPDGLAVMDFSDASNPKPLLTRKPNEYPFSGYNHSGWLTPDSKTYIMADENHGSPLKVFDVSDLTNGRVVSTLYATKDSSIAIPHNPLVSCDYAYVSYYYDGLLVYNIKNPSKPILEAHYPTSTLPNLKSYKGSWGNYPYLPSGNIIVADMQNGLFVLEAIEKPCNAVYSCQTQTDVNNTRENPYLLYPNPARDQLSLESVDKSSEIYYQILDLRACIIMEGNLTSIDDKFTISIEQLNPGMYIFRTYNKGAWNASRLVRIP